MRILIIFVIILIIGIYQGQKQENKPLKGPETQTLKEDKENQLNQHIETPGKDQHQAYPPGLAKIRKKVKESFGEPERVEPSPYGYEWWVYPISTKQYIQMGV